MVCMEDDDLAGLEDASSEGEENNYEADLIDGEAIRSGPPAARKTFRKRSRGIVFNPDVRSTIIA